jgi:23S rRNA (pseudouridine1915-N3)-methyltransferase
VVGRRARSADAAAFYGLGVASAMLLHVVAVGRLARSPEADLAERYLKRLPWPVKVTELSEAKADHPPPLLAPGKRIVLDETGKALKSGEFAAMLGGWRDAGARETQFLIGGADGHSAAVRGVADMTLSFGPMTWPHLLARAMLLEQVYRAVMILTKHPYHREG